MVGTSGSGKTHLAKQIASRLGLRHVELDAIHWLPNWTERPVDEFRRLLTEELQADGWVTDGNYGSKARDIIVGRAQTIVWLDYPLHLVVRRVTRRTATRIVGRQELWNGNRESLSDFFSRDNVILWAIRTHRRRRLEYQALLQESAWSHLTVVRLQSQKETGEWLMTISDDSTALPRPGTAPN